MDDTIKKSFKILIKFGKKWVIESYFQEPYEKFIETMNYVFKRINEQIKFYNELFNPKFELKDWVIRQGRNNKCQ